MPKRLLPTDGLTLSIRFSIFLQPKLTSINTSAQSTSSAIASAIGPSSSFGAQSTSPAAIEEGSGFDLPDVEAIEKRAEKKRRQSVGHTNKEVVTIGTSSSSHKAPLY